VLSAAVVLAGVATPAAAQAQARAPATAASVTGQLESVSCAGSGDCWAVGSTGGVTSGHAIIEHWNGSAWQVVLSENPPGAKTSYLGGVSCANATNCWAVGFYYNGKHGVLAATVPYAEHWNGQTWSAVNLPYPAHEAVKSNLLVAVSCPSARLCFAGGGYLHQSQGVQYEASLLERWNGSGWQVVPDPALPQSTTTSLQALSCASARDCWATGDWLYQPNPKKPPIRGGALGYHWNGARWTAVKIQNVVYKHVADLYAASCPTLSMCMSMGSIGAGADHPYARRWDGSSWVAAPVGTSDMSLYGVSCATSQACMAAGVTGAVPVTERWNGSSWATIPSPSPSGATSSAFNGITCPQPANCWAVGTWQTSTAEAVLVEHWNGTAWAIASS
jgi:hypothetical protein